MATFLAAAAPAGAGVAAGAAGGYEKTFVPTPRPAGKVPMPAAPMARADLIRDRPDVNGPQSRAIAAPTSKTSTTHGGMGTAPPPPPPPPRRPSGPGGGRGPPPGPPRLALPGVVPIIDPPASNMKSRLPAGTETA